MSRLQQAIDALREGPEDYMDELSEGRAVRLATADLLEAAAYIVALAKDGVALTIVGGSLDAAQKALIRVLVDRDGTT